MKDYTERNRALLHFIVTPTILLTVGLLGGLRIDCLIFRHFFRSFRHFYRIADDR